MQHTVERLVDSIGDALVAVDREGRVTRLSPRAEVLTGLSAAEARGKPVSAVVRIVDPTDRTGVEDLIARALNGEAIARSGPALLLGKDGTEHRIQDSVVPLRDSSGAVDGALLLLHDRGAQLTPRADDRYTHRAFMCSAIVSTTARCWPAVSSP